MWFNLFMQLVPAILRMFGLTRQHWQDAQRVTEEIRVQYEAGELDPEERKKVWWDRVGNALYKAARNNADFIVNLIRELAVLAAKKRSGALAIAGALLLLPSCTVIHGNQSAGTYTYASLGGDAREYAQTPGGVTAAGLDNSTSFRDASSTVRRVVYAQVAGSVVKAGLNAWKATDNAKTAAGLEKAKSADAVKTAEIQAKTEETAILNPAAQP